MSEDNNKCFCSFQDFKPFNNDGTVKDGVVLYDWEQRPGRRAVLAASISNPDLSAFVFYTDAGKTLAEMKRMLGCEILSGEEYDDKYYYPHIDKGIAGIAATLKRISSASAEIHSASGNIDKTPADYPLISLKDVAALRKSVEKASMRQFNTIKVRPDWSDRAYEYKGTSRYVLNCIEGTCGDGHEIHPQYPILCESLGLELYTVTCLKPVFPFSKQSRRSLFGYSVDGGVGCYAVAINIATGYMVPLDQHNAVSTHKHGWDWAHLYLGKEHGCSTQMVIIRDCGNRIEVDSGINHEDLGKRNGQTPKEILKALSILLRNTGIKPGTPVEYQYGESQAVKGRVAK